MRNLNARVMKRAWKAFHLEQMAVHKTNASMERPANKLHRLKCLLSCMTRAASVDDPASNSIVQASTDDSTNKKLYRSTIMHQPHLQFNSRSTPEKAIPEPGSQPSPSLDDPRLSISEAGQNARLARLATVIAKHCSEYRNEGDAEDICKQLKLYAQVISATSAETLSPKNTSISARLAMFYLSTLVPMDLVLKFPPALYTSIIADNARRASLDMVELNQIWSMFIGPAPGSWRILLSSRMRLLSESEVEKLCKLAAESLYCWAYWTLSIKMRGTGKEGAMNDDRWRDYVDKLTCTNHFDASAIAKQLIVVGWKYIDISNLRSTIDMVKVLEMSMSPARGFKGNRAKLAVREGKVNVGCQTSMSTATVPEEMAGSMIHHNKASPKATTGPEPAASVYQRSIGPGTYHIENDDADKIGKEPLQSSRSSQEDSTPEGENKESPKAEEKALRPAHSSPDILREINDELDAAISGRSVSPLEPMGARRVSQIPRPLTIRKSNPTMCAETAGKQRFVPLNKDDERGLTSVSSLEHLPPPRPPKSSNNTREQLPEQAVRTASTGASQGWFKASESPIQSQAVPRSRPCGPNAGQKTTCVLRSKLPVIQKRQKQCERP